MPACGVRPSVRLSVMFVSCVKRINISSKFFTILAFPYQTGWRYSDGNPSNGGVKCRWGRQKTRFWTNIAAYSVVNRASREVWKIKPRRTASSRSLTVASVVRCSHKTTTKCLWRARRDTPETEVNSCSPPGHNPVGHNSVFCCRRTSFYSLSYTLVSP